MLLTSKFWE